MRSLRVRTVPISEVSRAIETAGYSCRMERKVSAETEPIMTSVSAITLAERGAPSMAAYSPKHSPAGMSRKATYLLAPETRITRTPAGTLKTTAVQAYRWTMDCWWG